MSEAAAPAEPGKGESAAAVAFGTISAVPTRKRKNGGTTAAQWATPSHASEATLTPATSIEGAEAHQTRNAEAHDQPARGPGAGDLAEHHPAKQRP